ncbi:hypothetical protein NEISUBOT_03416 [Neisseria subflava NJ9703]|uniref:Uncharacterized protein n=1 Tax=Neisseria subflava NJ9703 TaxID=546268 RepID=A0A9W5ITE3_NEISU|nr:hypothetical protein NEISUBOT_03416 [Neisseria subflava NJ9703]
MIQKKPSETYPCQFQTAFLHLLYLLLTWNKPWFAVHFFSCIYF